VISRWTRLRVLICGVVFVLCAVKIGQRAYELQVNRADELRGRAEDQHVREIELAPQRGRILDHKGVELAASAQFDSIACVSPRRLTAAPGAIEKLAAALKLERKALQQAIGRAVEAKRYFVWVKRAVSPEESAAVRALQLPGLHFTREPKRVYPAREAGGTVVGHTNVDGRGMEGLEKALDPYLRGTVTRVQGLRDGKGRELLLEGLVDRKATAGKDVVLTLDSYLTFIAHRALAGAVKKWNAKGGTVVVMEPRTGDILAMDSLPSYDPGVPGNAVAEGRTRNRSITDLIEPGSTMKTFTLAATIDAGKVKPSDLIDCQAGVPLMIGKSRVRDLHPQGVITAAEVLQRSSNVGTVKIARRLGKQKLHEALVRFGLGRRTGVGLAGERAGVLYNYQKWGDIHFANIAFGYGVMVTPLQLASGYAAVANGGVYQPPRLVQKVIHPDGREEVMPRPAGANEPVRVVSAATARTMLEIMTGVTGPEGTASRAVVEGFEVAGKTGTAQKWVNGKWGPWTSSFIGIVPAQDPRLVIAVILDEPEPEHRGGMVAAPAFRDIAQAALQYLAVAPDPRLLATDRAKAAARGAVAEADVPAGEAHSELVGADLIEGPGSDQPLWGGPEDMQDTTPALGEDEAPTALAAGEAAGAETEPAAIAEAAARSADQITVPSFVGMSIGQAIRAAREAGVDIAAEGSGLAVAQSPPPGPRPRGALCRVSFRPGG
jgi:cell division protein FtsI (penicillin-binding protein 3)